MTDSGQGRRSRQLTHCVLDASVLAKLYLPEEGASTATWLVAGLSENPPSVRSVPDLAYTECGNIFWKWVRRGQLSAVVAHEAIDGLRSLSLRRWDSRVLLNASLTRALDLDITIYDATYLTLAELLDVPLVTADAALVRKTGGLDGRLILLSDLTSAGPDPPAS